MKWAGMFNYTCFAWVDLVKDRYKRQLRPDCANNKMLAYEAKQLDENKHMALDDGNVGCGVLYSVFVCVCVVVKKSTNISSRE